MALFYGPTWGFEAVSSRSGCSIIHLAEIFNVLSIFCSVRFVQIYTEFILKDFAVVVREVL